MNSHCFIQYYRIHRHTGCTAGNGEHDTTPDRTSKKLTAIVRYGTWRPQRHIAIAELSQSELIQGMHAPT